MIPFNRPPYIGVEQKYVSASIQNNKLSGDGPFSQKCQQWFEAHLSCKKTLMMPSCTHALETMAILLDIKPGDEVIMPSFTFSSTANAFALRGAKLVFVDIRKDTMNIDENTIESAISKNTKAIMIVHYAGVACEMDKIVAISEAHGIPLVEDAAQGMMASYKGQPLGTFGCLGAFSFHETKNYSCGEGGLLIINDPQYIERADIIREKGTNRSKFFRGMVDKYSWVDIGSSYLVSDISSAYLYAQLLSAEKINTDRLSTWQLYYDALLPLENEKKIVLPQIPKECTHNAHMFYIKVANIEERSDLISHLNDKDIKAVFHYLPLHESEAGKKYGSFIGENKNTTTESLRILRLPIYYRMKKSDVEQVVLEIKRFF